MIRVLPGKVFVNHSVKIIVFSVSQKWILEFWKIYDLLQSLLNVALEWFVSYVRNFQRKARAGLNEREAL